MRRRVRPRSTARIVEEARHQQETEARRLEAEKDPTLLSGESFGGKDLHPSTKRALTETMGLREMTEVQARTFDHVVSGKSLVARARTGTGKTLAFLLPTLERLLKHDKDLYLPGRGIGMLVVAPTRELAIQIADEAERLMNFQSKEDAVYCVYGGTKMQRDIAMFQKRLPTILVATPGRLRDHVAETRLAGRRFADMLSSTKIVVLDEMDCLLDLGFISSRSYRSFHDQKGDRRCSSRQQHPQLCKKLSVQSWIHALKR